MSDVVSAVSLVLLFSCCCIADAIVGRSYVRDQTMEDSEPDGLSSGSGLLEDPAQTVDRAQNDVKKIRVKGVRMFLRHYLPATIVGRSRSLVHIVKPSPVEPDPAEHACGLTNIILNTSWINWKGMYVRVRDQRRKVNRIFPPYMNFTLTVCDGLCRMGGDSENKLKFKTPHAKLLARLDTRKVVNDKRLRGKPCCVASTFEDSVQPFSIIFMDKSETLHEGQMENLKNAASCVCL